jgi:hypothetical protein
MLLALGLASGASAQTELNADMNISATGGAVDANNAVSNTNGEPSGTALVLMRQQTNNQILPNDELNDDAFDSIDSSIGFEGGAFNGQQVNNNNLNMGVGVNDTSNAESEGVAIAALSQVTSNTIDNDDQDLLDGAFTADQSYNNAFALQQVNVNNINTGMNAAQQGSINIGAGVGAYQ